VEEPAKEVTRQCPEPLLVEVCETNDIADGGVWLIFVAGDELLWLRGIHHWIEEPILDEP
jgi:hypothetical protein